MDKQDPKRVSVFSRLGRPAASFSRYEKQIQIQFVTKEKYDYAEMKNKRTKEKYQVEAFKETFKQRSSENMENTNTKYVQYSQNNLLGVNGAGPEIYSITPPYSPLQFHQPQFTPFFQPIQEAFPVAPLYTEPINSTQLNWNTGLTQKVMNDQVFYREDESENNLVIDEQYESNVNSILGNASTDPLRKVTEWKKSSMMQESLRKEISHMDIKRHEIQFVDATHNTHRPGLKLELLKGLYRAPDFTPGMVKKNQEKIHKLTNIESGQLYEGPELKPLLGLMNEFKKSRSIYQLKRNHEEGRIHLTGGTFQYRRFKGYLNDQLNSDAIHKLVKKPLLSAMLEDVGYKTTQEDDGSRYLQHGTMEVWKNILETRETQKPEQAGDLLYAFNKQAWTEEPLEINNLELRMECTRLMDMGITTLGMDIKTLKTDFPLTYELNMIMCLQQIMSEWTSGQGSCITIPVSSRVQIYQEEKPF